MYVHNGKDYTSTLMRVAGNIAGFVVCGADGEGDDVTYEGLLDHVADRSHALAVKILDRCLQTDVQR